MARVDYKKQKSHLFFDYQLINEDIELPGSLSKAQVLADPQQVGSTPNDANKSATNIYRVGLNTILDNQWNLETEITQRDSSIKGKSYGSDFTQEREHIAITPRFIGAFPSEYGDMLVTVGIDHNIYNYDYKLPAFSYDTVAKEQTSAIYAQFVIPFSEKITATFGGRYAKVKYNITDVSAFPTGSDINDKVNVFEAGLSYKLDNNSRLFARIDENFRFAKVDENTYTSPGVVGLDAQKGQSIEIGSEWKNSSSAINVTAYLLKLENEIDYDTSATKPSWAPAFFGTGANANLDKTSRQGLIIDLKHQFSRKLTVRSQYNYINAKFSGGVFDNKAIPFVSEHSLTLNANYKLNSEWATYAEARYNHEKYQAGDYTNQGDVLPALTLINAQVQYKTGNWQTSLRINNLTNEKYASYITYSSFGSGYYSAPERNISAKVKYSF